MRTNDIGDKIKNIVISTFDKTRIKSLLYFGTSAFNITANNEYDFDFILILDKYHQNDLIKLRKAIIKNGLNKFNIDLNFLYLTDIKKRGIENFQIRSLRTDFCDYLKTSIVLYGTNIFKNKSFSLSKKQIRSMFDFKIQEHYGRCDKLFTKAYPNEQIYKNLTKYTRDFVKFLLIRQGMIKIVDMSKYSYQDFIKIANENKLFNMTTQKQLIRLIKPFSGDKDVLEVDKIRRNIYLAYLDIYKNSSVK